MVKVSFKQIDLLRKRRKEGFLAEPFFIDTKKYIKKGFLSGLVLIAISLTIGTPFVFRIKLLENKKNKIKVFSDQYDLLQKKLDQESKQLKEISTLNNNLKNSIFNISSSSALLKEISLIIPKDIQLLGFKSKGNSIFMKAKLLNRKYLETLNLFLLNLDKSEFVQFNKIDLKRIKLSNVNPAKSNESSYTVDIDTKVSTIYKDINEKYLIKLGANGLLNRLTILKNIDKNNN